ncbi:MAG: efflux RND transporter periplasmic adaptor subunit [Magnetococcales bacterium]|nr:efflux RND transporter periplasmic adaptor subunit [Magnetococcales bacterium]
MNGKRRQWWCGLLLVGLLTGSGQIQAAEPATQEGKGEARKILYYRNPMGLPDTSPVPKKDSMGMDYIPVYAEVRKILYYRNPMGLPDTSPTPKKDSMGMDYIPVYADEGGTSTTGSVRIDLDKVQKLGVKSEAVSLRPLTRPIRAVGTVQVDERRLHVVSLRYEGWIEKLHADASGQTVRRGEPLMEVYSPALLLAQEEYLAALRAEKSLQEADAETRRTAGLLAEGALNRLRNWEIPEAPLHRLRREQQVLKTMTVNAPVSGVILDKGALRGMRFMPGEMLYRIADLSQVWVVAELFEQDMAWVDVGQHAEVTLNAMPGKTYTGKVSFIYPLLTPETRTVKVRIELANPEGKLRPSLYATVQFSGRSGEQSVLTVPDSAIMDSGARQVVLVERGEGLYEPRLLRIGSRGNGYSEVLDGVREGEKVVVRANFLIDAEANLRAAMGHFAHE